jgi:hypothetical protein
LKEPVVRFEIKKLTETENLNFTSFQKIGELLQQKTKWD